jgi:hypothetical protein
VCGLPRNEGTPHAELFYDIQVNGSREMLLGETVSQVKGKARAFANIFPHHCEVCQNATVAVSVISRSSEESGNDYHALQCVRVQIE